MARLWSRKSPEGREFEAVLFHPMTGNVSLSTQQRIGTFFELRKTKAAKGEGRAPPFISGAQDTVGLWHSMRPSAIRLWGTFTFIFYLLPRTTKHLKDAIRI